MNTVLISMEELMKESPSFSVPVPGTMVEGRVINVFKNKILVDLDGVNTGIISGKEAVDSLATIDELTPGDEITALVLEPENSEGLVVLSLRKASQHRTWKKFVEFYNSREVIKVKITEANKGGLLVEVDSIKGFIPVSQLAPLNYPRVNGANSAKILARLQKLVGQVLDVRIINIDEDNRKLILSEKDAQEESRKTSLKGLKIGEVVDGKISGVVNFGIFVTFDGLEGLVHISEIAWGHVSNPADFGKLGDPVKIKIIGIDGEKISLSMKQLTENPWLGIEDRFKIGQKVEGEINRLTEYGAFVTLADDINGLIHVSETEGEEGVEAVAAMFKVGDKVKAEIINIDIENHRIGLSVNDGKSSKSKKKAGNDTESTDTASDIEELGLSDKISNALVAAGVKTKAELAKLTEEDLTNIDGIGPAAAKKIVEKLA